MDLSEQPAEQAFLRHPWELAKRQFLIRLVRRQGLSSRPLRVLDAGAGDGWVGTELLRAMHPGASLLSWDINYRASPAPSDRHRFTAALVDADTCDLLLLLDVLEHVAAPHDWLAALVSGHVAPGGHAVISVPAWPFLYGRHDRALMHHCRFRPAEARRLIEQAGLDAVCGGGLFLSLLPVRLAGRIMERLARPGPACAQPERLVWRWGRLSQWMVTSLLDLDCRLALALAGWRIPFPGLSWWVLCRKRPS